jgi:hypothetical protein
MADGRAAMARVLRDEFEAERADGFPRLKRVPSTQVVRFLDYFAALGSDEQAGLAEALADHGSFYFSPPVPYPYHGNAACQRFAAAASTWKLSEGLRYTGLKLLAALAKGSTESALTDRFRARAPPAWRFSRRKTSCRKGPRWPPSRRARCGSKSVPPSPAVLPRA